jgi:carboxypeptidase Q
LRKLLSFLLFNGLIVSAQTVTVGSDSAMLRKIYDHYLTESRCYSDLRELTTTIGGRLSGSPQADRAVEWAKKVMYAAGADTVILQPCMVPVWDRGKKEICRMHSGTAKPVALNCTALGSSDGTGAGGIRAKVIEVSTFEELAALGQDEVKGKIVFYNVFFDRKNVRTGVSYGQSVKFRGIGASHAAKHGAVAMVLRSMTSTDDDEPHTGNMRYDTTISKTRIPAVALSYKAADLLHETLQKNKNTEIYLETHCKNLPQKQSFNVVGQLTGAQHPNEFIITGGHLDSWDNGQGAHDDGAGIVQSIEVLAAFKKLGIKPAHSVRAVAFMNEENGLAGGNAYADFAKKNKEKHIAAIETDAGGFTPRGFGVDTLNGLYDLVVKWKGLFYPYYIERIEKGGGGADLIALEKLGVPCIGFEPDTQRYFDIHHTAADTFDKINRRELELGAAGIGAMIYLIDRHFKGGR